MAYKRYKGNNVRDVGSHLRRPTREEHAASRDLFEQIEAQLRIIAMAEAKLKKLKDSCKHVVIYEVAGAIGARHCSACNELLGII